MKNLMTTVTLCLCAVFSSLGCAEDPNEFVIECDPAANPLDYDCDGISAADGDNCPTVSNPIVGGIGQPDSDHDGVGDACDYCPEDMGPRANNGCPMSDADADADADADDAFEGDEPGECTDDADNDRDGLFDCADPGCAASTACDERDTYEGDEFGECMDDADNDRDGLFDCDDPGCRVDEEVCGPATYCGDHACNDSETCASCPTDCGTCSATCGDWVCNGSETCATCAHDCGTCSPICGDGVCNGTETCSSCAGDCGSCGTPTRRVVIDYTAPAGTTTVTFYSSWTAWDYDLDLTPSGADGHLRVTYDLMPGTYRFNFNFMYVSPYWACTLPTPPYRVVGSMSVTVDGASTSTTQVTNYQEGCNFEFIVR